MNQAEMFTITTAVRFIHHQPSSMIHPTLSVTVSVDPFSKILVSSASIITHCKRPQAGCRVGNQCRDASNSSQGKLLPSQEAMTSYWDF